MRNIGMALWSVGSVAVEIQRMVRMYGMSEADALTTVRIIVLTTRAVTLR